MVKLRDNSIESRVNDAGNSWLTVRQPSDAGYVAVTKKQVAPASIGDFPRLPAVTGGT